MTRYIKLYEMFVNSAYKRNKTYYDNKFSASISIVENAKYGDIVSGDDIYLYVEYLVISGSQSQTYADSFVDGDLGKRIEKYPNYIFTQVPINEIILDEFYIDDNVVDEYETEYKNTQKYPPLILESKRNGLYRIIDGTHRGNAIKNSGVNEINAFVGTKKKQ